MGRLPIAASLVACLWVCLWNAPLVHGYPIKAPGLVVDWQAPPACPAQAEVERRLLEVHTQPTRKAGEAVTATVRIASQKDGGWRVSVIWTIPGQFPKERSVTGKDCAEVTDAAVLFLALAVAGPPPTAPSPSNSAPSIAVSTLAYGIVETGGPVGFAPGIGAGFAARRGSYSLALTGAFVPNKTGHIASDEEPGAEFYRVYGDLTVCALVGGRTVETGLCAGMEAGDQVGSGVGVFAPTTQHSLWLAPHISPNVRWSAFDSLRLHLGVQAAFPLYRPTFKVEPYSKLFRTDAVLLRGYFGVEWLFVSVQPAKRRPASR